MPEKINFEIIYEYKTLESGIVVPVLLEHGNEKATVRTKVDTGSQFCIFERRHCERLDLDVESGTPLKMRTAAGNFDTFGHRIVMSVFGIETESTVYFAAEYTFSLNVLGRHGWLDRVKLGLIDYDAKLFLSSYDQ